MILTLKNGEELVCRDDSTAFELFFDYNKNTFVELLDKLTYDNLNSALLEKFDGENNLLSTDCIIQKKISNVEIANEIVKVTLVSISSLEKDILNLQKSIDELMSAIESLMFLNDDEEEEL